MINFKHFLSKRNLTLANLITFVRILLLPIFFLFTFYFLRYANFYRYLSIACLIIILLSDLLDGYIARTHKTITSLGRLLDPLADKLFVTASFVLFCAFRKLPAWLAIVVVSKDLLILFGWIALLALEADISIHPSRSGKLAVVLQFITICGLLLDFPDKLNQLIWFLTSFVTIFAGCGYIIEGFKRSGSSLNKKKPND